jgi:hypothetical protein
MQWGMVRGHSSHALPECPLHAPSPAYIQILLGHKRRAPQKGQHGSCRISQPVILSRMLAMEPALCLRSCPRAAPRPVVRRRLRSCQLEPPRSCRGGKKGSFLPPGTRRPQCTASRDDETLATSGLQNAPAPTPASAPDSPAPQSSDAWPAAPALRALSPPAGSPTSTWSARPTRGASRPAATTPHAARRASSPGELAALALPRSAIGACGCFPPVRQPAAAPLGPSR